MLDAYRLLVVLRVRWYTLATARLMQRHWQWLLLMAIFVPMGTTGPVLLRGLAYPLTALLVSGKGLWWYFFYIIMAQALALAWVLLQRKQIRGGPFMVYVAALPISACVHRGVDLVLLLLANTILLVPLIVALPLSFVSPNIDAPLRVAMLLTLLLLTLSVQLAALERKPAILTSALLSDVLLASSLSMGRGLAAWSLLVLSALSVSGLLATRGADRRARTLWRGWRLRWRRSGSPRRRVLSPTLLIQMKALVARPGHTLMWVSAALIVSVGSGMLIRVFGFDRRALPTAILALAASALIVSAAYRTLSAAHERMKEFHAALPLGRQYWPKRDALFVVLVGFVPFVILMYPFLVHGRIVFGTLLLLLVAYVALLLLLRLPLVLFGGRQAALLGVLVAAMWSSAALAAIIG